MARFTDKVAVVTGASKGIGAGIAKRLAAEGASVVVNYGSSADDANRVVDDIVTWDITQTRWATRRTTARSWEMSR